MAFTLPTDFTAGSSAGISSLFGMSAEEMSKLNELLNSSKFARVDPTGTNAALSGIGGALGGLGGTFAGQGAATAGALDKAGADLSGLTPEVLAALKGAGQGIGTLSQGVQGATSAAGSNIAGLTPDVIASLRNAGVDLSALTGGVNAATAEAGRNIGAASTGVQNALGGVGRDIGSLTPELQAQLRAAGVDIGAAAGGSRAAQGGAATGLEALGREVGTQTGGIADTMLGISRGTDPAFEARRAALMGQIDRDAALGESSANAFLARSGITGTAALNEINNLNRDTSLRRADVTSSLGLEQLGRQDTARQQALNAFLQRGQAVSGITGQAADTRFRQAGMDIGAATTSAELASRGAEFSRNALLNQGNLALAGGQFATDAERARAALALQGGEFGRGATMDTANLALQGGQFASDAERARAALALQGGEFGRTAALDQGNLALQGGNFASGNIMNAGNLALQGGNFNLNALDRLGSTLTQRGTLAQQAFGNELTGADFNNQALTGELGMRNAAVQNILGLLGTDISFSAAQNAGGQTAAADIKTQIEELLAQLRLSGGGSGVAPTEGGG